MHALSAKGEDEFQAVCPASVAAAAALPRYRRRMLLSRRIDLWIRS